MAGATGSLQRVCKLVLFSVRFFDPLFSAGWLASFLKKRTLISVFLGPGKINLLLCVLDYHLLVAIEKRFLDRGVHTSWRTLRWQLSTHQVVSVGLPTADGKGLKILARAPPRNRSTAKSIPY